MSYGCQTSADKEKSSLLTITCTNCLRTDSLATPSTNLCIDDHQFKLKGDMLHILNWFKVNKFITDSCI